MPKKEQEREQKKTSTKKKKYVRRDWKQLEKEFLLGDYKSLTAFFKEKGISKNKSSNKMTKTWLEKKQQKETLKTSKIVEKVIEKEANKEANKIVSTKDTATKLLEKINESMEELNKYLAKNTRKTKTIEYNVQVGKPSKEIIDETEELREVISLIDRSGLKQLTSALKDVNDVLNGGNDPNASNSFAKSIEEAWSKRNEH